MWKKKLYAPLSGILRGTLPSTSRFSVDSVLRMQFCINSSSLSFLNTEQEPRVFPTQTSHFIRNLNSSGKSQFCSVSSEKVLARCWNCDAVAPRKLFLVCESCRSVQPVDHSVDYFQIFALEKNYEIEDENLEGKYKNWQKKLHPDLVHSKSEKEREYAAEQSSRLIDAYRTLTNPLSRAIYILKLEGVDVDEEKTVSEPELLAEIMEIREAVEEAADSQALNQIQAQMQDKLEQWSKSFANAFQSRKYEEALNSIQRMSYYKRANEEIVKKL